MSPVQFPNNEHPQAMLQSGNKLTSLKGCCALVIVAAVTSCGPHAGNRTVPQFRSVAIDVEKTNAYQAFAPSDWISVNYISIRVEGSINGIAHLLVDRYGPFVISNDVALAWGSDWFNTNCLIRYEPINVTTGSLVLHYQFN